MKTTPRLVIATPHARYDALEAALRDVHGLDVVRIREPSSLSRETLSDIGPRFVFIPHWSWIIPPSVHENFECVIFHMTDLPFGRGGSPLQNLIVRGIRETRLSALRCTEVLDGGPVYCKRPMRLDGSAEEILLHAARLMEGMVVEIVRENLSPQPQTGEPVVFARRKPDDGDIAGLDSLGLVNDYIRMLDADGYPRAFLRTGRLRLEFEQSTLADDHVSAVVRIRLDEGLEP